MSPGQLKRLRRIERRSLPEALAAYRAGRISARMLDSMLYLSPTEQRAELERRLRIAQERGHKSQLAAQTIRDYLDEVHDRIDLQDSAGRIGQALSVAV